jgi:ABC-type bacteriocin/lantibiotic exporter with double-glycine peptidase domain
VSEKVKKEEMKLFKKTFQGGLIPRRKQRYVRQRYLTDCGIAVSASVAGVGYERMRLKAHEILWHGKAPSNYITTMPMLKTLLKHFGIKAKNYKPTKSWLRIPDKAIVSIRYANGCGHFVLFMRDKTGHCCCYDPWLDKVRTDLHKMKLPRYYMEIPV